MTLKERKQKVNYRKAVFDPHHPCVAFRGACCGNCAERVFAERGYRTECKVLDAWVSFVAVCDAYKRLP